MGMLPPPAQPGQRRTALWKGPGFQPPAERPQGPTGDALGYRTGLKQNPDLSAYRQFVDGVAQGERMKRPGGTTGASIFGNRRPMRQIFTGP
jgi:hypothetical protein